VNRVVADSNILISAFLRGGNPLELFELARAGQIELTVSDDILNETSRVLRDKFGVPDADVAEYLQQVTDFAIHVTPIEKLDAVPGDATDNKILEAAVAAKADAVMTGDAHLLSLGEFRGIRIQRVADFLTDLKARGLWL
jgi:putative PIN family toxin of toxin-antitoxin system